MRLAGAQRLSSEYPEVHNSLTKHNWCQGTWRGQMSSGTYWVGARTPLRAAPANILISSAHSDDMRPALHFRPDLRYIAAMQRATTGLKFRVARTYEVMSRQAADLICTELRQRPNLLLCLSAGGTPARTYELLATRRARQPRVFQKLRVLQVDEWAGLPADSPASCAADLRAKVLEPLHISPNRYAGFKPDAVDPERECARIARWLALNGPIDVCILGLGENGHIAMNEPAGELNPSVHVAKLAPSSRKHPLLRTLVKKPLSGLTLGMGDILRSRKALLLVNGNHKRRPLSRLLAPHVSTHFPASFLWLHPDATILCDRDAATNIKHAPL
jgi:galactosamine-6-phosphate isomerase